MYAAPFAEIPQLAWEEVQTRNVKMPFLLAQQVLPRMAGREYGRVVNVVSELAERGMINGSAFARQPGRRALADPLAGRGMGPATTSASTRWAPAG